MEERSKRFEPGVASSDVIKQTIMSNPIIPDNKSTENLAAPPEAAKPETPRHHRSAIMNIGARRKAGGAEAFESSGMPTVPNNLRSQTPDALSDNRRVRVSK
ncbi:hypothetical protein EYF80_028862 [Liparis tanakae]|uniref:Uncharacterized protein n=1 Tax=Liparis tanakae TaxID=230148 RepID=A0A4Z2H4T3_9TELE|nr:hypothetical protein EYF80_028862 [Liparis tanakae]